MARQSAVSVRRTPTQARARQTIDTILDAAAQLLEHDGGAQLTTNHLAERSGYSIGTLYQYFGNREAVVVALIERQRAWFREQVDRIAQNGHGSDREDQVRAIVRLLHKTFARHRRMHPALIRALIAFSFARGLPEPSHHAVDAIVDLWNDAAYGEETVVTEADRFVLGSAIVEVLRAATLRSSPLLGTQELEDAIVRLVTGFLSPSKSGRSGA